MEKNALLEREILTHLERKLLNEVVRPALSQEKPDFLGGTQTTSETLDFKELLSGVKRFHQANGGNPNHWHKMIIELGL